MIKIFCGSDRTKIAAEVKKILGDNYEVFDGEELKNDDIINIFKGTSLFAKKRKILLKNLTEKRKNAVEEDKAEGSRDDFYEEIAKYADTEHEVVIWETTLSQKKTFKDFVEKNNIKIEEFKQTAPVDMRKVFGIFDTALNNGERAIEQLEEIEEKQDPYMFFGLLVSQALKKYEWRNGQKEKRVLKELAKLDIKLKSTSVEPWILIKSFLIRLSGI